MSSYVFKSPQFHFMAACPAWAEACAAFYRRNRTAFARFDPVQPEDFFTAEGQRELLEQAEAQAGEGRCFRFLLVRPGEPGKVVGMTALSEIVRGAFHSCFLAYKLDASLWGRGLGTEAVSYTTEWAFRVLNLHRVEANIMPWNAPSLGAAARAGFVREGVSKQYLRINGVWEDHVHMVRINDHWHP